MFFQSDIVIKGKKAEMILELKEKYGFDYIDTYMISGVLGSLSKDKDIQDNLSESTINIPRTVLNSRSKKLDFLYQVLTLNEELSVDVDNAVMLAFEENSTENAKKMYKQELFNDYAMGGINILYGMLSNIPYDNQVENLKNIIDNFQTNFQTKEKTAEEIFESEGL